MKLRLAAPLILLAGLAAPALQAHAGSETQRVPTVTRLVLLFSKLESELASAVQRGDAVAIDRMLADDFELRSGAMPGTPTPRAEWIRQSKRTAGGSIGQMAVHDYGAAAVVSYAWRPAPHHEVFVVDVWRKAGDAWKLSVRYAGPGGDLKFPIPGAVLEASPIEKRY
jgi:hypothetical protein